AAGGVTTGRRGSGSVTGGGSNRIAVSPSGAFRGGGALAGVVVRGALAAPVGLLPGPAGLVLAVTAPAEVDRPPAGVLLAGTVALAGAAGAALAGAALAGAAVAGAALTGTVALAGVALTGTVPLAGVALAEVALAE